MNATRTALFSICVLAGAAGCSLTAKRSGEARTGLEKARTLGFSDLPRDYLWLLSVAVLACGAASTDDPEMAAELHALLLPHRTEMVISQSLFLGPAHFLGLLATTLDRFDEACEHFAAAADAQERSGAAATLVHTQLEWARAVLFAHELGLSGLQPSDRCSRRGGERLSGLADSR